MPVELVDSGLDLEAEADRVSARVDDFFARLLASPPDSREQLFEAMRHAAIGGGKRLRPLLTIAAAQLFAIDEEQALRVGRGDRGDPRLFADPRRSAVDGR